MFGSTTGFCELRHRLSGNNIYNGKLVFFLKKPKIDVELSCVSVPSFGRRKGTCGS